MSNPTQPNDEMAFYRVAAACTNPNILREQGKHLFAADNLKGFKSHLVNEAYERGMRRSAIPTRLANAKSAAALPAAFAHYDVWKIYVAYVANGCVLTHGLLEAIDWNRVFGTARQREARERKAVERAEAETQAALDAARHYRALYEASKCGKNVAGDDPIGYLGSLLGDAAPAKFTKSKSTPRYESPYGAGVGAAGAAPVRVARMEHYPTDYDRAPGAPVKPAKSADQSTSGFVLPKSLPGFVNNLFGTGKQSWRAQEYDNEYDNESDNEYDNEEAKTVVNGEFVPGDHSGDHPMAAPPSPVYDYAPVQPPPASPVAAAPMAAAPMAAAPVVVGNHYQRVSQRAGMVWFDPETSKCHLGTKKGTRCKHPAKPSGVCGQHEKALDALQARDDDEPAAPSTPQAPRAAPSAAGAAPSVFNFPKPVVSDWSTRATGVGLKWYAAQTGKCHAGTNKGKRCSKNGDDSGLCSTHRSYVINHEAE